MIRTMTQTALNLATAPGHVVLAAAGKQERQKAEGRSSFCLHHDPSGDREGAGV